MSSGTPGWLPLPYITHYSFPRGIVLHSVDGDRSSFPEMMVHIYHLHIYIYISFYLTTRTNLHSDRFAWQQAAEYSPLFQFPLSRGQQVLVPCIALHIMLFPITFTKRCRKYYPTVRRQASRLTKTLFSIVEFLKDMRADRKWLDRCQIK